MNDEETMLIQSAPAKRHKIFPIGSASPLIVQHMHQRPTLMLAHALETEQLAQARHDFSQKLKWGPSDFSSEKIHGD